MNRLWGTRCYEIGPIDRANDCGAGWRNDLTPFLEKLGVIVLDPLNKPIDKSFEGIDARNKRNKFIEEEKYDDLSKEIKLLRIIDLRMVDLADFLICYIDVNIHTVGTYEELFWANRSKKPILICVEGGKKNTPHWLFGTIPHQHIFNNWEELKKYLIHVDQDENVEHYKRWTFFKYNEMLPKVPYRG